ncbi:uncharacterized protein [Branchiostoma lanceolatum]|uniref:uncharacterized protein isoform X2 n=1 Tax=Branchiostoma lanceolatum TaxID=7740 RepID=UPI0034541B8D
MTLPYKSKPFFFKCFHYRETKWLNANKKSQKESEKDQMEGKKQSYKGRYRCYNCNGLAHYARNCPSNRQPSRAGDNSTCFNCEGVGHLAHRCTSPRVFDPWTNGGSAYERGQGGGAMRRGRGGRAGSGGWWKGGEGGINIYFN